MPSVQWYWHRLRSMDGAELLGHARKKTWHRFDSFSVPSGGDFSQPGSYPSLPDPASVPTEVLQALKEDAEGILKGWWRFFGQMRLQVDMPPMWHKDYLAGTDVPSSKVGFKLNHRELPQDADVKLIWELSRWYDLVRLAQAAWLLGDKRYGEGCVQCLEDWVRCNPAYRGWNWTSPLESGMRLIQFAWIDALLAAADASAGKALDTLRSRILPPHVLYTWRYRSFGSSANNHLIGELAGLIVAGARWPDCQRWSARLQVLGGLWEKEVLAQFAPDGGNREQALNYQLYSWELSHHARLALEAAGMSIRGEVIERLDCAAKFFVEMQSEREPWDYGDSDNAFVSPIINHPKDAALEWRRWFTEPKASSALYFWMGERGSPRHGAQQGWQHFGESGYVTCRSGDWFLRWDVSPLGYLRTAAHGHLDALHVSLWFRGYAVVIDPGTGAYFGDLKLRSHLASREVHNGPAPEAPWFPERKGPFLWVQRHATPSVSPGKESWSAEFQAEAGKISRTIRALPEARGWEVEDTVTEHNGNAVPFSVCWQFAPGVGIRKLNERAFEIQIDGKAVLTFECDMEWSKVEVGSPVSPGPGLLGVVSPGFRQKALAPFIKLTHAGDKPCLLRSRFLAFITG